MTIGRLIKDAREAAELTQAALARRSGTSQTAISAYENGAKAPSASTLARILAAAGHRLAAAPAAPVVTPGAGELRRRGRILSQVLDLAERLPSRPGPALEFPGLPHGRSR